MVPSVTHARVNWARSNVLKSKVYGTKPLSWQGQVTTARSYFTGYEGSDKQIYCTKSVKP